MADKKTGGPTGDPSLDALLAGIAAGTNGGVAAPGTQAIGTQPLSVQAKAAAIQVLGFDPTDTISRSAITAQPFVGLMPNWLADNPDLRAAVSAGSLDPYLVMPHDPNTWRVYMGQIKPQKGKNIVDALLGTKPQQPGFFHPGKALDDSDKTATALTVKNEPYLWSQEQVTDAMDKFRKAGVQITDFDSLKTAWGAMVDRAAQTYSLSSGKVKMTPWDALEAERSARIASGQLTADGSSVHTATTRSVSDITQGDAWSALQQTLSRMLGRDPGHDEVRDFAYRMNSIAAKNPSITHATQTTDASGNTSTSQHTSGGFDTNDVAQGAYDKAQSDPDYAEYQSATTYFNAVASALGAIGGN